MDIHLKRVYEARDASDGVRILVDRLWPRGLSRTAADIDQWIPDAAPSSELRKWFSHDARRWGEFKRRYFAELDERHEDTAALRRIAGGRRVTLLFSARDTEMNNAAALREYLLDQ